MIIGVGLKMYAYLKREISTGKVKDLMDIRDIKLNYREENKSVSTTFTIWFLGKEKKIIFFPNNICRKPGIVIAPRPLTKTHQMTNNKRRRIIQDLNTTNHKTLPYGYRDV